MTDLILIMGGAAACLCAGACLACWRLRDRASSMPSFITNLRTVILRTGGQGEER